MPHIILLNGTSSAGKTTIAKLLQSRLEEPYLHVCIDAFEDMMPTRREQSGPFYSLTLLTGLLRGMHGSVRALADAGNNLILDHVIVEGDHPSTWLSDCIEAIRPFDVHIIAVRCTLDELERRERERGDRPVGIATWQTARMHLAICYDLELDTTDTTADECVDRILTVIKQPPGVALRQTALLLQDNAPKDPR